MNIQTKAGFKKEMLAYFRTNRFTAIALSLIGLAILSPLLLVGMGAFMTAMGDFYEEVMAMDVTGMAEMLGSYSSIGVSNSVANIATIGLLIFILLISRYAGGEQKKRADIIPRSAGLRSFGYIFPKFIIYPISAFVTGFIAVMAAWFVSGLVFENNDVAINVAVIAAVLVGVCMMLYICLHLALGTATGQAGMSAVVCIIASMLLPDLFIAVGVELAYNPFALSVLAMQAVNEGGATAPEMQEVVMTVIIAFVIMMISYFIAIFAQNARVIDNKGNEISL